MAADERTGAGGARRDRGGTGTPPIERGRAAGTVVESTPAAGGRFNPAAESVGNYRERTRGSTPGGRGDSPTPGARPSGSPAAAPAHALDDATAFGLPWRVLFWILSKRLGAWWALDDEEARALGAALANLYDALPIPDTESGIVKASAVLVTVVGETISGKIAEGKLRTLMAQRPPHMTEAEYMDALIGGMVNQFTQFAGGTQNGASEAVNYPPDDPTA